MWPWSPTPNSRGGEAGAVVNGSEGQRQRMQTLESGFVTLWLVCLHHGAFFFFLIATSLN